MTRIPVLTAAVLVVAGLLGAPALAAGGAKQGYYIEPKSQTYIVVTKGADAIKSFQTTCRVKGADGKPVDSSSMSVPNTKRLKISASGRFSYAGSAKLGVDQKARITISGRFSGGKAKGTITTDQKTAFCLPQTFTAKYYGLNPGG